MNPREEALTVLRTAEHQLRSILVRAAAVGDYDHLPRIAEWARLLTAALGGQPVAGLPPVQPESILQPPPKNGAHKEAAEQTAQSPATTARRLEAGPREKMRWSRAAKEGYPQFVREGDSLIKIGWSKTEGRTYEHKAPRGVLLALVQALIRVGSGGERFTLETLLPLKDTPSGSVIPDYQTYLTLAWLRTVGLVTQHGRQGYSLPPGSDLERETDRQWAKLDAR
jgi:hypothetical protein